jgi:putative methyltransferase (TIGR04325 family)
MAISGNELNVIDFGGACGAHYFFSKALARGRFSMRWHVVETPNMVNMASSLEDGQLKFYDDLEKAKNALGRVDIVFTSSTLQYVPRPYESLKRLTECGASSIFITRVGLSTLSTELIMVQAADLSANGPGPMPAGMKDSVTKYPVTFARKDKFEEIISKNYLIQIQLMEDKKAYSAGRHSIDMYGYLGVLKTTGK